MESMLVTSSVFPETYPLLNNIPSSPLPPSIKLHNTKRTGSLRFAQNPHFISLRLPALARHVSGGDGDDQGPLTNGSAFFSDETLSLPQVIMFFFLSFGHKGECFISWVDRLTIYEFMKVFARFKGVSGKRGKNSWGWMLFQRIWLSCLFFIQDWKERIFLLLRLERN